jgi:hypothetical protein
MTDFLVGLGIEKVDHTEKSFLAHLIGVYRFMKEAGCTEELCRAGMFHSIYGTQSFQGFKLPVERRPEVRALIGERAEWLAYLNSAMDRPAFDRALDRGQEPYLFLDRLTHQEVPLSTVDFDDLCRVHLSDWLEQVPRSRYGWDHRRQAYRRMAARLGPVAEAAHQRVFAQEPAAGLR